MPEKKLYIASCKIPDNVSLEAFLRHLQYVIAGGAHPPGPTLIGHVSQPTFFGGVAAETMHSYWNIPIC